MKRNTIYSIVAGVSFLVVLLGLPLYGQVSTPAANVNYCVQPLFSSATVKPNIMIVQDQSGSMQFPAYFGCNLDSYSGTLGNCCVRNTPADGYANDKYRANQNYYGYFENESYYQYVTANNRFEINATCGNTNRIGTAGCISGNLLNWITTTRTDVVRKALTGGRRYSSDTTSVTLQSEGARFDETGGSYSCNTPPATWRRSTLYKPGDTVTYPSGSTNYYVCITRHTSRSTFDATEATYWTTAVYDYVEYFNDNTLNCTFRIAATDTATRQLTISGSSCPLGTLTGAYVRVKKNKPVVNSVTQERWGIVHEFFDKVSFEFMIFKSDAISNYGKIMNGKTDPTKSTDEDGLYTNINTTLPYYGTPTGQAMKSAREYFRQKDQGLSYGTGNVSSFVALGDGRKDPWYDYNSTTSTSSAIPCRQSYILLLSDGNWNVGSAPDDDPAQIAYNLHTADQRTASLSNAVDRSQTVSTYTIYAFGDKDTDTAAKGRQSMITTAIMGGFAYDSTETGPMPYGFTSLPADSREVTYPISGCNPSGTWDAQCTEWDKEKTGLPYNFFEFTEEDDGEVLVNRITAAIYDMVRHSSSGTAASVLASSEGSGANLIQAVYYPKRLFTNGEIDWTGTLQALWYYLDPKFANSGIREDFDQNKILNLGIDPSLVFFFKQSENKTKALRGGATEIDLDEVRNLWEAGVVLWKTDPANRRLYTWTDSKTTLMDFNESNASLLMNYLQAKDTAEATNIIKFTYGYAPPDVPATFRGRLAKLTYQGTEETHVWKLGDIVSSTPRSKTGEALQDYHKSRPHGYDDRTYDLYTSDKNADGTDNTSGRYKVKGIVYAGANDGMLHAFHLGELKTGKDYITAPDLARMDGSSLGQELWAYIPKNALPYLRYMSDAGYQHVFTVDGAPQLIDVSAPVSPGDASSGVSQNERTRDSWRTILIGSMGIGGASRPQSGTCAGAGTDCVKAPIDKDGYRDIGRSSYFALDVTNPYNSPQPLWEFNHDNLGFTTSNVAALRVNDPAGDKTTNGRWFAVIASGPTGPINTTDFQFMGRSDQNLRIFILDLMSGNIVRTIDTGIANAFGGSIRNAMIDADKGSLSDVGKYSDDALYIGYTKKSGSIWNKGGVVRLLTGNDPNPANWTWSKVMDDIGPVTSAVTKLQDRKEGKVWLYFGTGRFFYRTNGGDTIDDADSQQAIYGVREPCYVHDTNKYDGTCTTTVSAGALKDMTSTGTGSVDDDGWIINLTATSSTTKAERIITDPTASTNGVVYFVSMSPSTDTCAGGGNTYLWAVDYKTGGSPITEANQGKALIQISSGAIASLDLKTALTEKNNRRSASFVGIPPKNEGLSLQKKPPAWNKILQIKEK